ncbi:Menaquinone via futalosine polyprenyltransferase (MenA homolog), Nitrosopumilus/Caldivirga type [uncultured Gammaproteobacteria bacterium]|nr:Menaquinone via futalosine polyprenyltransferase (MenA homolog), Nitrosopumilus/Caldivirga type [uncultured Gammaproteobacteria bacterium]CAC9950715.1 Menaquinone via futalosine polyprenyltransferase (MenA homolog), Nitrosopumilus/Caldivirga type [uncultured Gammaproteobacteria bacterium]SHN92293.1 Menaquinone via futalosine polyprenyltransferase(MenA homolog), Nitrosopumilus/Caldivirga type [Bathymodiolus heckerae thiotrophic gill symbiont]
MIRSIISSMRLPFLILTPVCLFLAWSPVFSKGVDIQVHLFVLTFIGAVMAHISVNTLNEYLDFKSGIDLNTNRTAFSGGSGALPNNPEMLKTIFTVGVVSLLITLLIGVFFIWTYGWQLFPIGMVGLILVIAYTRWINRYPWLCLIASGFGFGVLMTVGAHFAVTGFFNDKLWLISLVSFFLVNNLLLLNQYPDIDADKAAGRNHFPIAYGVSASNAVYLVFLLLTMLVVILGVLIDSLTNLSLIALLAIFPGFYALSGAIKFKEAIGQHSQYLAANVLVVLLVPVLLGITILFG